MEDNVAADNNIGQESIEILDNIKKKSVDKVVVVLKKMASAVVKFGEAMLEAGRVEPGNDILKNTFNSVSEMYNNLTSSQKEKPIASRNQDQDDDFFSDPDFFEVVAELKMQF
ncbi:conserved hypothetical protein [Ricinus communis]|uniref:Uncharacterized protein n=1 Tax=Ricinus communis TaxID=3988 RepID=B9S5T9_RICCO|nr:conserved hypothetical protein [Ricinus communis]